MSAINDKVSSMTVERASSYASKILIDKQGRVSKASFGKRFVVWITGGAKFGGSYNKVAVAKNVSQLFSDKSKMPKTVEGCKSNIAFLETLKHRISRENQSSPLDGAIKALRGKIDGIHNGQRDTLRAEVLVKRRAIISDHEYRSITDDDVNAVRGLFAQVEKGISGNGAPTIDRAKLEEALRGLRACVATRRQKVLTRYAHSSYNLKEEALREYNFLDPAATDEEKTRRYERALNHIEQRVEQIHVDLQAQYGPIYNIVLAEQNKHGSYLRQIDWKLSNYSEENIRRARSASDALPKLDAALEEGSLERYLCSLVGEGKTTEQARREIELGQSSLLTFEGVVEAKILKPLRAIRFNNNDANDVTSSKLAAIVIALSNLKKEKAVNLLERIFAEVEINISTSNAHILYALGKAREGSQISEEFNKILGLAQVQKERIREGSRLVQLLESFSEGSTAAQDGEGSEIFNFQGFGAKVAAVVSIDLRIEVDRSVRNLAYHNGAGLVAATTPAIDIPVIREARVKDPRVVRSEGASPADSGASSLDHTPVVSDGEEDVGSRIVDDDPDLIRAREIKARMDAEVDDFDLDAVIDRLVRQ